MQYLTQAKIYWNRIANLPEVRMHIADEWARKEDIIELMERENKDWYTVIEIGCGIGRLIEPLAKAHQDGVFLGIDIASDMLALAPKLPNVNYTTIFLPGKDASFIYSFLVFQHMPDEEKIEYIRKSYITLKQGGKMMFQFVVGKEHEPFSYMTSVKKMKDAMKAQGFRDIKTQKGFLHKDWCVIWATK